MKRLIRKQLDLFLDPFDEEVIAQAEKDGINQEWITAAQNSPVYKLAIEYKMAFHCILNLELCRWCGIVHL